MKVKTSITLSSDVFKELSRLGKGGQNRSRLIEEAVILYLRQGAKKRRNARDLKILNETADALNKEAEDVLSYQADL